MRNIGSLEYHEMWSCLGAACGIVAQPLGAGRVRMSCPRLFTHRLDDLKPEEEVQLFSRFALSSCHFMLQMV